MDADNRLECKLNLEEDKRCAALEKPVKQNGGKFPRRRFICRVFDEPLRKLETCPLEEAEFGRPEK